MPHPLVVIAWISLAVGVICFIVIIADIVAGHHQHMAIMNIVWPVTALWSGPLGLWAYWRFGRLSTKQAMANADAQQPAARHAQALLGDFRPRRHALRQRMHAGRPAGRMELLFSSPFAHLVWLPHFVS